ncbi:MAG: hypothetical protein E7413_01200 [Ruminococcaceae bacterium]|nr:hypothetical protein [Oscillospiraceae bacterium]
MKKQTKQEKIAKKNLNTAEIKLQKEKIENRLLTIFATALGAEMLLMYLFNWFQTNSNMMNVARGAAHILMIVFLALAVFTAVKGTLLKKADETERSKKYFNWFYVCLASFLGTFFVYPTEILTKIFGIDPLKLTDFNNFHPFLANNGVQFRAALLMCGVGIYTVAAFIIYGVKSAKLGKIQK